MSTTSKLLSAVGAVGAITALASLPSFLKAVRSVNPEVVTIEQVARGEISEGVIVTVSAIRDPRWHFVEVAPNLPPLRVGLLLEPGELVEEGAAVLQDTASGWAADCRRYREEGFSTELLEFDSEMKEFEERWGRFEQALSSGIPNVWSRFAVGTQAPAEAGEASAFSYQFEPERPWRFVGHAPAATELPPYPEDFEYTTPRSSSERRALRRRLASYHEGQKAYYDAACLALEAELSSFMEQRLFVERAQVTGRVQRMGVASNGAFEAIKGTALPIYYVLAEGAEVSSAELGLAPGGALLALIGLIGGWRAGRRRNFGLDDEDFLVD